MSFLDQRELGNPAPSEVSHLKVGSVGDDQEPEVPHRLHVIEFLTHLRRVAGERLLVIWDGSPIHCRSEVRDFVSGTHGKVWLEATPGYAPDLNPWDEGGWHHLKHVQMRNVVCRDLEELHEQLHLAVGRLRQKPQLVRSFFAQAGLELGKS
jgi:transposase